MESGEIIQTKRFHKKSQQGFLSKTIGKLTRLFLVATYPTKTVITFISYKWFHKQKS